MRTDMGEELQERYCDDAPGTARTLTVDMCVNREIALTVTGQEPMFFDALDLLRAVSHVALDLVYGPSPTDGGELS